MALTAVNAFRPVRYVGNVALYVAPQDSVHFPGGDTTTAQLTGEDITWKNIANAATAEFAFDTDTDPENNYDAVSGMRINKQNPYVTSRYWTVEVERDSPFINAVFAGVRNPFDSTVIAKMGDGQDLPIYASTKPVPVCVKQEIHDSDGTLMYTMFYYGDMTPNGSRNYDDKSLKASVRIDVTSSQFSIQQNTKDFTGQTEVPPSEP